MLLPSLIFVLLGGLYVVFAFREPPAAIAHHFPIPIFAVFLPEERRVKVGRIMMGVLLLLSGPMAGLLPRGSLLGTAGGIVLLGLWIAAKLKHGREISEADDAERRAQWQSFELLKRDPRFLHLQQHLAVKGYRTAFERVSDPTAYRVVYIDLRDAKYQRLLAQDGAAARQVIAYLERDAAPKRIRACLDLQTGVCVESEAGWMTWDGFIPLQLLRA